QGCGGGWDDPAAEGDSQSPAAYFQATAMTESLLNKARRHERELLLGAATDVVDVSFGQIVLNREFPSALSHNVILVDTDVTAEGLLAESAAIRQRIGFDWCAIWVGAQQRVQNLRPGLQAAGYNRSTDLFMALAAPSAKVADHPVEKVTFEEIRPSLEAFWRGTGRSAMGASALAGRATTYRGACELSHFGVRQGDRYASFCEVYRRDGTGQIDSVITDPASQGRGYASAVVIEACRYLQGVGCDFVFLCTDAEDWPQELYRKLGFRDLGTSYKFE
ncbi:MAG: GNAT family N-acetyltransferase, partial [bacterium]|nr:GNAT family N-acetyltransferase [bacterium]